MLVAIPATAGAIDNADGNRIIKTKKISVEPSDTKLKLELSVDDNDAAYLTLYKMKDGKYRKVTRVKGKRKFKDAQRTAA